MWDDWIMLIALAITYCWLPLECLLFTGRGWGLSPALCLVYLWRVYGTTFELVEIFAAALFIFFATLMITAFGPRREGSEWARIWARRILMACVLILFTIVAFAVFWRLGRNWAGFCAVVYRGGNRSFCDVGAGSVFLRDNHDWCEYETESSAAYGAGNGCGRPGLQASRYT